MGCINQNNKDSFYMNITIIGPHMDNFYNIFQKSKILEKIQKFWEIKLINKNDISNRIKEYFIDLKKTKIDGVAAINLRECLIVEINNIFEQEINTILKNMNELSETQYLPLVLLLVKGNLSNKFEINNDEYDSFDQRLIFLSNYTENPNQFEKEIAPIFVRFCSIHNDLGDDFTLFDKEERFDLREKGFPFNLNIACIGRFGQGKSTGINEILQEYKAKESSKGCSQTKKISFYQVKNQPIRILDIPGFENEQTVREVINQFQSLGKLINHMRDNIHIILYFLNYSEKRAFMKLEYPMIEEIVKHESTSLIYVITHSIPNLKEKSKIKIYDRINSGIQEITTDKLSYDKIKMFKADENNVVFVNFHKREDLNIEPFGQKELFKKIHDFFINSKDYKYLKNNCDKKLIEENAMKLRAQAQYELYPNIVIGGIAGIFPFVDIPFQHFYIKKKAIKIVGEKFGIDIKFIDEENKKDKRKEYEQKKPEYTTKNIDKEYQIDSVEGENLNKFQTKEIYTRLASAGSYIKGGQALNQSAQIAKKADEAAKAAKSSDIVAKLCKIIKPDLYEYAKESAQQASKKASIASASASNSKVLGYSLPVIGVIAGAASGLFFTYTFCEELLDTFVNYYKNNEEKVLNSYENAAKYFLNE